MKREKTSTYQMVSGYINSWKNSVISIKTSSQTEDRIAKTIVNAGGVIGLLGIAAGLPATMLYDTLKNKNSTFRSYTTYFVDQTKEVWKSDENVSEKVQLTSIGLLMYAITSPIIFTGSLLADQIVLNDFSKRTITQKNTAQPNLTMI